MIAYLQGVLAV